MPRGTEAGDLEDEDTVVVEEVVHLTEEGAVATDANMLSNIISPPFCVSYQTQKETHTSAISKLTIFV